MDISKGRNKNSRKFYKKTTKFLKCVQKHTIPYNHNSGTEKLVHQSIHIANLQTEKYPAIYQANPESCKYYIVKRRFTVKQRKWGKNGVYMSNSQEQARRCKQTHINRFFIAPSSYALQMDEFDKILKKKGTSEKIKKCYVPYSNSIPVVSKKSFDTKSFKSKFSTKQSKENVCIMNNQLNSGNALLFQCSADSLQLEQSKIKERKKRNLYENFNSKQSIGNMKKRENYNNINDILPNLMQQVTVYRILENMKRGSNSEDIYSSVSTCSSSSSTREYYLPAVSSSTDTMHVANVLANRRLVELPNTQEEIISKPRNGNQGICIKSYNKNNSNLSPVFQQAPLENEILSFNNIQKKDVELELEQSNHQIIQILKDDDELMPFFPFTRFNSLVIKNKSRIIKNYEQSSIGVQTQENKIYEKDEDDSIIFKAIKNKRIKLSKENFIVNNNTKHNESLGITMENSKKEHLNLLPVVTTQNCTQLTKNLNKEVIRVLSEHLYDTHANEKEKITLDCNYSNSNLSNISMSSPKNKSISEDVLFTIKNKSNITHSIKTGIQKPKSSLCISNIKSESSKLPLCYKSHSNASDDSLIASKPHFVKLNPFFDAGFNDPKISKLILSSRTLAGESDSTIPNIKIPSDLTDTNAETFTVNPNKGKYQKPATMIEMVTGSSINEENKQEVEHNCNSNRSIFSADSIIYGSNAFQKIREKFDLIKNKMFQQKQSLNKERVLSPKPLFEKKLEVQNGGNDISQANNNNNNTTAPNKCFSMNENQKKLNSVSLENEEFSDKREYILLLPRKLNLSNHQSHHSFQELGLTDEKNKTIGSSSSLGKSVDVSKMDNEHESIDVNLNRSYSKNEVKPTPSEDEVKKIVKEAIDTKYSSEKQTQVNMYIVDTLEKPAAGSNSNEIPLKKNQEISAVLDSNAVQTVMLNDISHEKARLFNDNNQTDAIVMNNNIQSKAIMSNNNFQIDAKILNNNVQANATMLNNNVQVELTMTNNDDQIKETMLNNDAQVEATVSKNNSQAEGKMLNNYGQPVILYNSSGYPITDLNGRVLKNNLGAYLLNSDKYEDVITKQLPVFDCDLMSVSSISFNPTKMPLVKIQFKITDRCGNPVSLFNNLGWPLTNQDGFFLHDNLGKLLVEMDSFNFPLCCSNGSPVYLQNGAMLLSQKFKFVVTKPDAEINCTSRPLKIGRRYENEVVNSCNIKDNKISNVETIECSKTIQPLNESSSKDFKSSNFLKPKKRIPNFRHNLFFPTEVPELMHEFFDNKARPKFSNSKSQGSIPQSPIPIFDRAGNRLTDENGFPLKNKYGEYMLLLDKNGIALSDSCGGPIFDSNGKQLWLKDLYHMKKNPSLYYLYDRYIPPEHPFIDTSTSNNAQSTHDSSDDLIQLLDLNFENEQSSEPIMNYIKENNIKAYDSAGQQVHFFQNMHWRTHRKPIRTSFLNTLSVPTNIEHYVQPSMASIKENLLFYETRSYQEENEYRNSYESLSQQIDENNIPYGYEQSIYEDSVLSQQHPQVNNFEHYDNYYYDEQRFSDSSEFHQDAEIQYYVDDNNYVMYY